jgi:flagellum-specific ATP synthase
MQLGLNDLSSRLSNIQGIRQWGRVVQVVGDIVEADAPSASLGAFAKIGKSVCEVVGFRANRALLMPLDSVQRIRMGDPVEFTRGLLSIPVGERLLGRVIDPLGRPLDDKVLPQGLMSKPLKGPAPNPMKRSIINQSLFTGVRVIDGMLTLGQGQRIGIMAGSGVGKSTLMGMLARSSSADVNIIALVGERGREVREFLERDLADGLKKSIVVVSTSNVSPALQIKGVEAAMSLAEYFRDKGNNVLVLIDSITRLAMAQRQIGLSAGEPPTTKGYPPSVFTMLPRLLERGGPGEGKGSITSVNTVLVEGDDINDPIGDTVRSIVDGHVVLSRRLVSYGHYPPVDVLQSLSRTMPSTVTKEHLSAAQTIRRYLSIYEENEELIRLGAYKKGSDNEVDIAIELKPNIDAFLRQGVDEFTPYEDSVKVLMSISTQAKQMEADDKRRQ